MDSKKPKKHKLLKRALTTVAVVGTVASAVAGVKQFTNANADSTNKIKLETSYKGFKAQIPLSQFPIYASAKGEPLFHSDFITTNNTQAWCTNYSDFTPDGGSATVAKHPASALQFHVLLNGYPLNSPSKLGVNSKLEAIAATQYAVWVASGNFSQSQMNWNSSLGYGAQVTTQAARNRVKAAMEKILSLAKKDTRGQGQPSLKLKQIGTMQTNADGSTESQYKLEVTKGYENDLSELKLKDVQVPTGSTITQDGKTLSQGSKVDLKSPIIVKTPAPESSTGSGASDNNTNTSATGNTTTGSSSTTNNSSTSNGNSSSSNSKEIHLGFKAVVKVWTDAAYYETRNDGVRRQNVLLQSTVDPEQLTIGTDTTQKTPDTSGNIKVHKVGNHDDPLENIKFDLLNADKKVIASGTTNEYGNVSFKNLNPGTYYVREADTDSEHEVDHALHDVSFTAQDAKNDNVPNITISNDEITDNPYIKSAATEVGTGSRYIDAKNESLQDELAIENLDGTHRYQVVDTLMDVKTGDPAKIDGKPVTATQNITASGKSGEKVEERLTMKFDKANFKGLQGKRYAFQARIYKLADYDNGKLLATEFSLNDTNQSIMVTKPVITTQVRSAIGKDSTTDTQRINPYTKSRWIDNVSVENLVKDHDYTAHLKMMIKGSDGKVTPLKVHGKEVTADKDFTADNEHMNFDVDFGEVDTTELKGKDLVVYANVSPKEESDNALATHNEADDKNETLHVTNPIMQTHALIDDDSVSNPNHSSRLLDRVTYSDVAENQPITLSAIASDKDKKAIVISSKSSNNSNGSTKEYDYLMGKVEFTPVADSGTQDVQLQKVAVGSTDKDKDGSDLAKDISNPTVRAALNTLKPVAPGEVNIDDDKAAQEASNSAWKETLAGKLGYEPADNSDVYNIDTTSIAGKQMVIFEDMTIDDDKTPASSHADVDDKDQTIRITNPKIYTKALLNSHKISNPSQVSRLSDVVRYEDVAVGHPLELSALATNQKDGTPITIKKGDNTYNLMGRIMVYPTAGKGSAIVPLQMVLNGNPANNSAGGQNINSTNVNNIRVENVKDDRTMKATHEAVASITNDGSSNWVDPMDNLNKTISYADTLVYQSSQGMPTDLTDSLEKLNKVIGNGKDVNLTDLISATNALSKTISKNVNGGVLVTNDQFEAVKAKQQATTDSVSTNTSTTSSSSTVSDSNSSETSSSQDFTSEDASLTRVANNHIKVVDPREDSDANKDLDSDKYNIDTTQLRGVTMTMFEDMTSPQDNNKTSITTEANLKNTDQSVRVTKPSIETMQTISDEKTIFSDTKDAKIVDKVQFKDFAPNEQVTLTAVDMDKGTKEAAKINNSFIVGRRTFTPKSAYGTVKVFMSTRREEPEAMYMVKQLQANGLPSENASTTEQAHSTKTANQLLNMNNGSISDSSDTSSSSNGQTDTNDTNTVETNRNGDNGYESQADNSVGSDNVDDHMDTSETSTDLSWLDKLANGANDPTNREFKWTAFETAETADGTVITEHKDMSSEDQTVTIKTPTPSEKKAKKDTDKIVINNNNGQGQTNGNSKSKSSGGNSNNTNTNKTGSGSSTPQLAQTGSGSKYSSNPILDFFAKLFR